MNVSFPEQHDESLSALITVDFSQYGAAPAVASINLSQSNGRIAVFYEAELGQIFALAKSSGRTAQERDADRDCR